MNALVCSGGGAKGAFTAGVVAHLLRDQKISFDIAVGTSTGALIGGPALLGDWTYLRDVYVGVDNDSILKNSLLGKFISLFVAGSIPIQASMDPMRDLLHDYYIERKKLQRLNDAGKNLVVISVNVKTGKTTSVSSRQVPNEISAETFLDAIVASASIPLFCRPVRIFAREQGHRQRKDLFYDGGVREFLPFNEAAKLQARRVWAVSTHPLKFNQTKWGGNTAADDVNLLKAAKWVMDAALNEVERGDLFRALAYGRVGRARLRIEQIATDRSLDPATQRALLRVIDDIFERVPDQVEDVYVIHPRKQMSASLEFDPATMLAYYVDGFAAAEEFYATAGGAPQFTDAGGFVLKLP